MGLNLPLNFRKWGERAGGLTESQRGVTFFQRGCSFFIRNELKSEIFNDKKLHKTKMFLCHNYEFKLRSKEF